MIVVFVLTLTSFRSAPAATHTVKFGGSLGLNYSPNLLIVAVGDVITWEGDFTMHPLHFEFVPDGATKPADVNTGTTFSYTVTVPGDYGYWCNFHFSTGMVGGFTTSTENVDRPIDAKMLAVVENPVHQDSPLKVDLGFDASKIKQVNLCTSDGILSMFIEGTGYRIEGSRLIIPNTSWGAGAYVLSIVTGDATYQRKIVITR
jgi:plastocyanin